MCWSAFRVGNIVDSGVMSWAARDTPVHKFRHWWEEELVQEMSRKAVIDGTRVGEGAENEAMWYTFPSLMISPFFALLCADADDDYYNGNVGDIDSSFFFVLLYFPPHLEWYCFSQVELNPAKVILLLSYLFMRNAFYLETRFVCESQNPFFQLNDKHQHMISS